MKPASGKWRAMTVLILVFLLVLAGGCGSKPPAEPRDPAPPAAPGPAPTPPPPGSPPPSAPSGLYPPGWLAGLRNPSDFELLLMEFAELEYTVTVDGSPMEVKYKFGGSERVRDRSCLRGTFDLAMGRESNKLTVWIDDYTGRLIQAEIDGQRLDDYAAEFMIEGLMGMAFLPFQILEEHRAGFVLSGAEQPEFYRLTRLSSKQERVANRNATVTRYRVEYFDDDARQEWAIADFGDFQLLVEWQLDGGDEFDMTMAVRRVALR